MRETEQDKNRDSELLAPVGKQKVSRLIGADAHNALDCKLVKSETATSDSIANHIYLSTSPLSFHHYCFPNFELVGAKRQILPLISPVESIHLD